MFRKMSKEREDQKCRHVVIRLFGFYIKPFSVIWLSRVETSDYQ